MKTEKYVIIYSTNRRNHMPGTITFNFTDRDKGNGEVIFDTSGDKIEKATLTNMEAQYDGGNQTWSFEFVSYSQNELKDLTESNDYNTFNVRNMKNRFIKYVITVKHGASSQIGPGPGSGTGGNTSGG